MYSNYTAAFSFLFRTGSAGIGDPQERRRIILSNQMAFICVLVSGVMMIQISILNGLRPIFLAMSLFSLAACAVGFLLNARKHFRTMRLVLFLWLNMTVAFATALVGTQNQIEIFFLPLACGPILFLSERQKISLYSMSALSILLLLFSIPYKEFYGAVIEITDEAKIAGQYMIFLASPLALVAVLIWSHQGTIYVEGQLQEEKRRSEGLLLNILPAPIADRLKSGERLIADRYESSTVLFADLVGFTPLSATLAPEELVKLLNEIVTGFDTLCEDHGLEKIKTIGDSYMAVAGVPAKARDHAERATEMAIAMRNLLASISEENGRDLQIRIGLHSGPVIAGVIGNKKFVYDLWGDTVNIASRMESHGHPGRIHISEGVYSSLGSRFKVQSRGETEIKGRGSMRTYWI